MMGLPGSSRQQVHPPPRLRKQRYHRPQRADPIAHVVVAHGFAEYTRRQVNLAEALVSAGMSVLRYDMRGHGHSGGRRGHVERFDDYVDDLCDMVERARTPDVPLYVVGHSQGGLITTRAMMQGRLRAAAHPEPVCALDLLSLANEALLLSGQVAVFQGPKPHSAFVPPSA